MIRDQQRVHFKPIKIILTDIVLILAKAWPDCYGDNVKAIAKYRWGPLNREVLHHPDILRTKRIVESTNTNSSITTNNITTITNEAPANNDILDDANVSSGAAYVVISKLVTAQRRDVGREQ